MSIKKIAIAAVAGALFATSFSITWNYLLSRKNTEGATFQPRVVEEEPQSLDTLPPELYSLTQSTLGCTSLTFQGLMNGDHPPSEDPALLQRYTAVLQQEGFLPSDNAYATLEQLCRTSDVLLYGNEYMLVLPEDATLFYVTLNKATAPYLLLGLRGADTRLTEVTDDYQWLKNDDIYLLDTTRDGRVDFLVAQDSENGACTGVFLDKFLYVFYSVDSEHANPKIITMSIPQEVYAKTIDEVARNSQSHKEHCPKPEVY